MFFRYFEANNVVIVVKDNGKGIEKDNHQFIFERYKQASNLFTRESECSGIGLSLIKTLIEMHGGSISVESNYGNGCEFIVKLPIRVEIGGEMERNNINYISDNERFIEKMKIEFSDIYK